MPHDRCLKRDTLRDDTSEGGAISVSRCTSDLLEIA
jgi:hypothetical protein